MNTKRLASALVGLTLGAGMAITFALGDPATAPVKTGYDHRSVGPVESRGRINQAAGPTQPDAAQTVVRVHHSWSRPPAVVPQSVTVQTPPKPAEPARSVVQAAVAPRVTEPASPVGPRAAAPTTTTPTTTPTTVAPVVRNTAPRPVVQMEYVYIANGGFCIQVGLAEALESHMTIIRPDQCWNGHFFPLGWNKDHTGPANPCGYQACPQPVEYPRP